MTFFKDKKLRLEFAYGLSKLFVGSRDYFWVVERFFSTRCTTMGWEEAETEIKM
jgi:hypothetical protein